ncbi:DUF2793 domain-containing protein [uncultured Microbulbifer sp.]|uniref:DUF2793 domain-containing protein n=1 Tax=uncultured Microbulbifer sp. TaxID=348147 RepID=UPI00260937A3|nr:DUF2793 domain-containing protein [uncultured Microbulbifer sp.]
MNTVGALLPLEVQTIQNDPPASVSDGDRYLVATGTGTGDWAGEDGQLARYVAAPS